MKQNKWSFWNFLTFLLAWRVTTNQNMSYESDGNFSKYNIWFWFHLPLLFEVLILFLFWFVPEFFMFFWHFQLFRTNIAVFFPWPNWLSFALKIRKLSNDLDLIGHLHNKVIKVNFSPLVISISLFNYKAYRILLIKW